MKLTDGMLSVDFEELAILRQALFLTCLVGDGTDLSASELPIISGYEAREFEQVLRELDRVTGREAEQRQTVAALLSEANGLADEELDRRAGGVRELVEAARSLGVDVPDRLAEVADMTSPPRSRPSDGAQGDDRRAAALRDLIELRVPVADARERLAELPRDSDEEVMVLDAAHLSQALSRFLDGGISESELQEWADALEVRDDVGRDPADEKLLTDALHRLATPELVGSTRETVEDLAAGLGIEPRIALDLSYDEAIVLLDWLSRMSDADAYVVDDQAEERVLWDLEAVLETKIVEMGADDYQARLGLARERVRDVEE